MSYSPCWKVGKGLIWLLKRLKRKETHAGILNPPPQNQFGLRKYQRILGIHIHSALIMLDRLMR